MNWTDVQIRCNEDGRWENITDECIGKDSSVYVQLNQSM